MNAIRALAVLALAAVLAGGCSSAGKDDVSTDEGDPGLRVSPLDAEALAARRGRELADVSEAERLAATAGSDPGSVVALYDLEGRLLDGIERELNAIFSRVRRDSGSAFPYSDRNLDLFTAELKKSSIPVVRYYRSNERAFRVDRRPHGGFFVTRSLWRLREIAGTQQGLARLFEERKKELRIDLQGVCFPELEGDCGERPAAAECLKRVERFLVEFPDPDFRDERRKIFAEHVDWLRLRRDEGWVKGLHDPDKASRVIDPYIERIQAFAER